MSELIGRREFCSGTAASAILLLSNTLKAGSPQDNAAPHRVATIGRTGYVYDPRYLAYSLPHLYHESPERLETVHRHLQQTGLLDILLRISPDEDVMRQVNRVHSRHHIDTILKLPGSTATVASLAAGGVTAAVRAVHEKRARNVFCAVRPPGHHAQNTGREEGFCYYNNIAIGARYAQSLGYKKILIIDWDYHHGNGTEEAFYEDPSVLFFSTHNQRAYPGTGSPKRTGKGAGLGYTINVHLGCGAGDGEMMNAWREKLLPAAERFKPDFLLISAGFDSREGDPLGCFRITDSGFVAMTAAAGNIAKTHCDGRIVSVLEGGYDPQGLASAVHAHIVQLRSTR
jgi:acetoin utilization deacetylase AcuC-like enzyme